MSIAHPHASFTSLHMTSPMRLYVASHRARRAHAPVCLRLRRHVRLCRRVPHRVLHAFACVTAYLMHASCVVSPPKIASFMLV